jgi:hypothetical protein
MNGWLDSFAVELDKLFKQMSDYHDTQLGIHVGGVATYADLSGDELGDLEEAIHDVGEAIDCLTWREKEKKP